MIKWWCSGKTGLRDFSCNCSVAAANVSDLQSSYLWHFE